METGFPSPAQGYEEKTIDLNSLLIKHPAATIFMEIDSDCYNHIGIYKGDLLIIDRALQVHYGDYVVYESEGAFKLGRTDILAKQNKTQFLNHSYNTAFGATNPFPFGNDIIICGVITKVIHTVRNKILPQKQQSATSNHM